MKLPSLQSARHHSRAKPLTILTVLLLVPLCSILAQAAGPNPAKREAESPATAGEKPPVAAFVGDEPVYVAEVEDLFSLFQRAAAAGDDTPEAKIQALEQAIHLRLAAQYLAKEGYAIDEQETLALVDELKRKLEVQKQTFDEFLRRHGLSELMVRRRLQWDAMWSQFLANEATDEALEEYFQANRRLFDGTELRVSHILWPVKPAGDAKKLAAATAEAERARALIISGKLTFAAAAQKYSAGPSRRHGGDLGFIPAHDVMSESFSLAAWKLEKGAVSEPVVDQFGVHLITCTDVKPGERTWREVRRELAAAFRRDKFLELATAQRKRVAVKIIGEP